MPGVKAQHRNRPSDRISIYKDLDPNTELELNFQCQDEIEYVYKSLKAIKDNHSRNNSIKSLIDFDELINFDNGVVSNYHICVYLLVSEAINREAGNFDSLVNYKHRGERIIFKIGELDDMGISYHLLPDLIGEEIIVFSITDKHKEMLEIIEKAFEVQSWLFNRIGLIEALTEFLVVEPNKLDKHEELLFSKNPPHREIIRITLETLNIIDTQ